MIKSQGRKCKIVISTNLKRERVLMEGTDASSDENTKILIIIPAYNEELTIGSVVALAKKYGDILLLLRK